MRSYNYLPRIELFLSKTKLEKSFDNSTKNSAPVVICGRNFVLLATLFRSYFAVLLLQLQKIRPRICCFRPLLRFAAEL
jgi:hypothetical protein